MLLSQLFKLDIRRRALKLQQLLLDHAYGEYLDVELEPATFDDVFQGSNIKTTHSRKHDPAIVMRVNDKFDSDRADPYGPKGIIVVVTEGFIFVQAFPDDPKTLKSLSSSSQDFRDVDETVISMVLKHFVVFVIGHGGLTKKTANKGTDGALTFILNSQLYRFKSVLSPSMIKVGQTLLIRHTTLDSAQIANLVDIQSGNQSFSSMQEVLKHFKVKSLIDLTTGTITEARVKLQIELGYKPDDQGSIYIQRRGSLATWIYDGASCALSLMEKL